MRLREGPRHRAALGGRERGRGKIDADILYAAAVQPLVLAPQVVQHTQVERAAVVKFVRQDGDALHPAEQCGIALQNIAAEGDLDQRADRKLTVVEQLAKLRLIVLERKLARVERINVAPLAVHIREQQYVVLADRYHAAARGRGRSLGRRLLIAAADAGGQAVPAQPASRAQSSDRMSKRERLRFMEGTSSNGFCFLRRTGKKNFVPKIFTKSRGNGLDIPKKRWYFDLS